MPVWALFVSSPRVTRDNWKKKKKKQLPADVALFGLLLPLPEGLVVLRAHLETFRLTSPATALTADNSPAS